MSWDLSDDWCVISDLDFAKTQQQFCRSLESMMDSGKRVKCAVPESTEAAKWRQVIADSLSPLSCLRLSTLYAPWAGLQ